MRVAVATGLTLSWLWLVPNAASAAVPPLSTQRYPGSIALDVDARDNQRRIFHVRETIPVSAGPLVLWYPQWLPGNHSPSGRIDEISGLLCTAAGKPVSWLRDTVDVWAFHFDIASGVSQLTCDFDFLSPLDAAQGREVMTPAIVGVEWNQVLLYPAGYASGAIDFKATLRLPDGFSFATALRRDDGGALDDISGPISFAPVTLETLVDSPLFSGRYLRRIDLDPDAAAAHRPTIMLNIVADRPASLAATPEQIAAHRRLVEQADRLFGTRHYAHYDFLFALSDQFGGIGLEHHQSSENGVRPGYFTEPGTSSPGKSLLPHEYTHSWNGKYRRPADLTTADFNLPMQDSLLWVYEGQTDYWGNVLAARSGLVDAATARDVLASIAAQYDERAGRVWRDLQDTTNQPIVGGRRDGAWTDWVRSADYYAEMDLVWLDADTRIRALSGDTRSLDDFARAFFGGTGGRAEVRTYTFDDVVAALEQVQHDDWRGFLRARLDSHGPAGPLDGLARGGWKLAFDDRQSDYLKAVDTAYKSNSFAYSLGFDVSDDAHLTRMRWKSPAFMAGLAERMVLVAVDGRTYKAELLKEAITANRDGRHPIELIVKSGDYYRTVTIDYRDGLRYPHLVRIEGTRDRLSAIWSAKP